MIAVGGIEIKRRKKIWTKTGARVVSKKKTNKKNSKKKNLKKCYFNQSGPNLFMVRFTSHHVSGVKGITRGCDTHVSDVLNVIFSLALILFNSLTYKKVNFRKFISWRLKTKMLLRNLQWNSKTSKQIAIETTAARYMHWIFWYEKHY